MAAGASAASEMDAAFRTIIDNDPEIQAVIRGVWGNATRDERPSDTPKNLEKANAAASKQIGQILARKGIALPDRTFINPRSGTIEGHRGWAGLSGLQKGAILAAAAVATGGALGAAGAFGGAAGGAAGGGGGAAAAGGGGLAAAPGVTAGMGGLGLTGASLVTPWAGAVAPSMIGGGLASGLSASSLAGGLAGGGGATAGGGGLLAGLGKTLGSKAGVGNLLEGVGAVAGGIGASQGEERKEGVNYSILRDKLGLDASSQNEQGLVNRADLDIRERGETRTDLNNAFQKSLQANLVKSWPGAPSMPSRIPTFNLGATGPTQDARDAASEMDRQMMVKILAGGGKGQPLPAYQPYQLQSPAEMPGASTSEKMMDLIGLGGTAVGNFLNPSDSTANFQKWLAQFGGSTR